MNHKRIEDMSVAEREHHWRHLEARFHRQPGDTKIIGILIAITLGWGALIVYGLTTI